jgi:glucose/arabinose dehydrogenase
MLLLALALSLQVPDEDAPGKRHLVLPRALPRPYATRSTIATPILIRGRGEAPLQLPPGFRASVFAERLQSPRWMLVAPNGDVFCTESYQGRLTLLRDTDGDGAADRRFVFASGLRLPFGLALHGEYLYVANTDSVVRFRYRPGQTEAHSPPETIISGIPSRGRSQHWTRNLIFDPTGRKLYLTVGSETNKSPEPPPRATILQFNPDGSGRRTFATGLRNPVGLAFRPGTSELWITCVERDYMGDDLVPDFVTRVRQGDFFGWPWFYIGSHRDPRVPLPKGPKLPVRVPDVLVTAHSIPLGLLFYTGTQFPPEYRGDAFVAMRGSTNRRLMVGYKVVRLRFEGGRLVPGYEDFATGWLPDPRQREVWGRPVGLAQWTDGSLLLTDEAAHKIWRIRYVGSK